MYNNTKTKERKKDAIKVKTCKTKYVPESGKKIFCMQTFFCKKLWAKKRTNK